MKEVGEGLYEKIFIDKKGRRSKIFFVKRKCVYCGEACFQRKSSLEKGCNAFCNKSCQTSFHNKTIPQSESRRKKASDRAKKKYQGENNPNYRGGPVPFLCNNCEKIFHLTRDRLADREGKFCSFECYREYMKKNRKPAIENKIHRSIKGGILNSLKKNSASKGRRKWEVLLGYTTQDLITHLESLFQDGMTWDNYGFYGWHIDHVIPKSCFDFSSVDDEQFLECWSLKNLQPLWAKDNLKKGGIHRMTDIKCKNKNI